MPDLDAVNAKRDEIFRDYAWSYFALHAEQRLKAFQFYITLSTAVIGGYLLLVRNGETHKWIGILGFLLAFLSFVFWKLDCRTRSLVKNAEEAIKFLDESHNLPHIDGRPHPLKIFSRDDHFTEQAPHWPIASGYFSYSRCFKWVFVVFALAGMVVGVTSLLLLPR